MTEMNRTEVLTTLQKYLADVRVNDLTSGAPEIVFAIDEPSLHPSEFAWRVQLLPSREPRRWSYVYEEIAILEETIAEETGLNLFITVVDTFSPETPLPVAIAA
jgi:hypothetical protein